MVTNGPAKWLASVQANSRDHEAFGEISGKDAAEEYLMMGLRLKTGVARNRLEPLDLGDGLTHLSDIGMLNFDDEKIWLTEQGRPLLNAVLRELLAD